MGQLVSVSSFPFLSFLSELQGPEVEEGKERKGAHPKQQLWVLSPQENKHTFTLTVLPDSFVQLFLNLCLFTRNLIFFSYVITAPLAISPSH
jgi:hypothetical protein